MMAEEYNLFTWMDFEAEKKAKKKVYTLEEYRDYIIKHFSPDYSNKTFYNIALSYFTGSWESVISPEEQFEYFMQLYSGFTYHLFNEKYTIFSLKHKYSNVPDEYSVFVHVHGDYIVEFTRVHDLFNDPMSAPACGIEWYTEDGKRCTEGYMLMTEAEEEILRMFDEIKPPKDTSSCSYREWFMDRREFYFFCKLHLHKFGKPCRVFDKHIYDCFADYTWTLNDMYKYLHDNGGAECQ